MSNKELLKFVIISVILVTLMRGSGVMMYGEIRYSSVFGVKGFWTLKQ